MIFEYSACLSFSPLSRERFEDLRRLIAKSRFEFECTNTSLEFVYSGRDSKRKVANLFVEIAKVLVSAQGEISCTISDDETAEPEFEFFTIDEGKLFVQKGRIVRDAEVSVFLKCEES